AAEEGTTLPFILRNENFAFEERVAAVIIDAGAVVNDASLSAEDFDVHVVSTRMVDPDVVAYDGPERSPTCTSAWSRTGVSPPTMDGTSCWTSHTSDGATAAPPVTAASISRLSTP